MFRFARLLLGALAASLVLTAVPSAAPAGTVAQSDTPLPGTPTTGVTFNDPSSRWHHRDILDKVVRAIRATPAGEQIHIVVWNLEDKRVVDALLDAQQRGVTVQAIMSTQVNDNWLRLVDGLNVVPDDDSFAYNCSRACRSSAGITHVKIFLFSQAGSASKVSMFGSTNLTSAAGARQWNDMITTTQGDLYDYWLQKFAEFAADKALANPYQVRSFGPFRSTLFPATPREPVLNELNRVRCHGATGGTGNGAGRTEVRVAISGWFDAYGSHIAERLRELWDHGCDVKITTTLAGRGVNRLMHRRTGRGPVPMREVTVDRDADGIPERYLHLKVLAVSGVYAGDTSASVVFTGSPNWSARAQDSDEVWVRVLGRASLTRQYQRRVDWLYTLPFAHVARVAAGTTARTTTTDGTAVPRWFDND